MCTHKHTPRHPAPRERRPSPAVRPRTTSRRFSPPLQASRGMIDPDPGRRCSVHLPARCSARRQQQQQRIPATQGAAVCVYVCAAPSFREVARACPSESFCGAPSVHSELRCDVPFWTSRKGPNSAATLPTLVHSHVHTNTHCRFLMQFVRLVNSKESGSVGTNQG